MPFTVLPVIQDLMASGISVWMYSGDTDGNVAVTTSRYSRNKLQTSVKIPLHPWMYQGEVGGFVVGYQNLTFIWTLRAKLSTRACSSSLHFLLGGKASYQSLNKT